MKHFFKNILLALALGVSTITASSQTRQRTPQMHRDGTRVHHPQHSVPLKPMPAHHPQIKHHNPPHHHHSHPVITQHRSYCYSHVWYVYENKYGEVYLTRYYQGSFVLHNGLIFRFIKENYF